MLSEESADTIPTRGAAHLVALVAGRSARRHARVRQAQRRVHRQHRADRRRRCRVRRDPGAGHRCVVAWRARPRCVPARRRPRCRGARAHAGARRRCASPPAVRIAIARTEALLAIAQASARQRTGRAGFVAQVLPARRRRHGRVSALRPDQRMGHRGRAGDPRSRGRLRARPARAGRCATTSATPCSTAISSRLAIPRCPGRIGWLDMASTI